MSRQTLLWTLALALPFALGSSASAELTTISFKKLTSDDHGSNESALDADASFTTVVQDAIIGHGINAEGRGGFLGDGEVGRLNSGSRAADTLGRFNNLDLSVVMKWNPNAPDQTGNFTMPAPGEADSAILRLNFSHGTIGTDGDDWVVAKLLAPLFDANTYFGDQNEGFPGDAGFWTPAGC